MLFAKTSRSIPKPREFQLFEESIQWVDEARYLGVTLDIRLTLSKYTDQVRKKAAERLGTIGTLLNRRSGLSISNGVLVYKQLIRSTMEYACPVWRFAAHYHYKKLQVRQSKCFDIATNAPWSVGNSKFATIWEYPLLRPYQISEIRLNVSWCG